MSSLYQAILPYQTRVLYLPHKPEATATDPLECTLHVADILHPHFGGLGLRSVDNEDDRLVEFCALSYAWGSPVPSKTLVCNGKRISITTNLHDALTAIRQKDYGADYFWADAICINQDDEKEKAVQVSQMLQIFQQAKHVVAWLGDPGLLLEDVKAALKLRASQESLAVADLEQVVRGAEWMYSAPWFERLWVQQELFASKSLLFLCGPLRLNENSLLSAPQRFERYLTQQDRAADGNTVARNSWFKSKRKSSATTPSTANGSRFLELLRHGASRTYCYQYFSNVDNVDLVEALLYTSNTKASNPRDYVYGLLGLSNYPAEAMSLGDWTRSVFRENYVPIDYGIDLISLNCVLSRILLNKLGLGLLAKFKIVEQEDESKVEHDRLPSWVIDWRLTSKWVRLDPNPRYNVIRKLNNAWDIQSMDCPDAQQTKNVAHVGRPKLFQWPRPPDHIRFCDDNTSGNGFDIRTLLIDGRICSKAILDTKRRTVRIQYAREKRFQQISWRLPVDLRDDDVVVSFPAFARADYTMWMIVSQSTLNGTVTRKPFVSAQPDLDTIPYASGGLWVLRPVKENRFKLVACLSLIKKARFPPYEPWMIDETLIGDERGLVPLMVRQTKDSSIDTGPMKQEPYQAIEPLLGDIQTFAIV